VTDDAEAIARAEEIGYPVMIKASAGGGGKGLRFVPSAKAFPDALRITRTEARAAFGDDAVFVEKAIEEPRHIEIQVLADGHGRAVHLGERECTIQRRHQKVIEECPSPFLDPDLRRRMGAAALRVVDAAGYANAGTVEFLVDRHRNFHFLEMNTRLQVEHPVTEAVTGIDLVRWQIRIAAGEPLDFLQDDVEMRGAALECRIYAEDPENGFLPSPGRIASLRAPSGPGIRDDSGIYPGWTVPIEYDPLLSKLVAWGPSRRIAIERMKRALAEYRIMGIRHNVDFFRRVLDDADFRAGKFDTGFIDRWVARHYPTEESDTDGDLALILAALARHRETPGAPQCSPTVRTSRWKRGGRERGTRPFRRGQEPER
jgi:acetyl-CoA carboxylase biotin carboxylase subunit